MALGWIVWKTPHACVLRTRSELNKHIPVGCVPVKDLRTRSKVAAAKKADIRVSFRPFRYEGAAVRSFERFH